MCNRTKTRELTRQKAQTTNQHTIARNASWKSSIQPGLVRRWFWGFFGAGIGAPNALQNPDQSRLQLSFFCFDDSNEYQFGGAMTVPSWLAKRTVPLLGIIVWKTWCSGCAIFCCTRLTKLTCCHADSPDVNPKYPLPKHLSRRCPSWRWLRMTWASGWIARLLTDGHIINWNTILFLI